MFSEGELGPDPLRVFTAWYDDAVRAGVPFADAMSVATVDAQGRPRVRVLLYKGISEGGLRFFTNLESEKGRELTRTPYVATVFHWPSTGRQVRIDGSVERLADAEADEYFQSRPRFSQIGAWASPQSQRIPNRAWLEDRLSEMEQRFGEGPVPRPPHWGGYRLVPDRIEFWIDRDHRLHDRFLYEREGSLWQLCRLAP